ncbi:MAG: hypothetical protein AMJ54_15425 [Deltaproteobacteria bacterium SG8_13]|nr:MAG: hypothetical protein AMJ54_15425 [Deltaproteobacteria bacterium SG8_13]
MPNADQQKIVLLVKDRARRDNLRSQLADWGFVPFIFENERTCLANLLPLNPDLVIAGSLTADRAIRFIHSLKMIRTNLPLLIITEDGGFKEIIETNGFTNVRLVAEHSPSAVIRSAIHSTLSSFTGEPDEAGYPVIIGDSPAMTRIKNMIPRLGQTNEAVLIIGEPGTGKELVASAIHRRSSRRKFPLLKVNAVELPYRLLEGELFGYAPPSLKNVPLNQNGMFTFADGGTVFIKEIWALPDFLQGKLIKYLEISKPPAEAADAADRSVDLRIIASTTKDLTDLTDSGEFRTDLYHRLDVIRLRLPPLRQRVEDIAPLTDFFIDKYCLECGRSRLGLSEEMRSTLQTYFWPNNVMELEQLVRRAVLQGDNKRLMKDLAAGNRQNSSARNAERCQGPNHLAGQEEIRQYLRETSDYSLKGVRQEFMLRAEKRFIKKALDKANWNRKKAARILDISYKSLLNKMKVFDLS